MSSIHWIQSQCGFYIFGTTLYALCVDKNLCFNTKVVCICSINAVGGAVVMVSAATLLQIVTTLSAGHCPPPTDVLVISRWWQYPGSPVILQMIIILAIDLQISPQTIRSLQNNFLSELFWWIPARSLSLKIARQREHTSHHNLTHWENIWRIFSFII